MGRSGQLGLALMAYGVPALLRIGWGRRRIAVTDVDPNGDLVGAGIRRGEACCPRLEGLHLGPLILRN